MIRQHWIPGGYDEGDILAEIVGWHLGCWNARAAHNAVAYLNARGYLTTRTHYFADGSAGEAYALTERGFARLKEIRPDRYAGAVRAHAWYAENARRIQAGEPPLGPEVLP